MKLKIVAAAALLAVASVGSHATTTALGAATVGVPLSFGGFATPGPFSDIFTFSLPANNGSGYSVTNFVSLPAQFNTVLTTLSVVSNPDGVLFNLDYALVGSSVVPGGNSITLVMAANPAGNYYLNLTGISNGQQGGIYNGAISVTAVPEPETYAMFLAGLGALGFLARRRKNV